MSEIKLTLQGFGRAPAAMGLNALAADGDRAAVALPNSWNCAPLDISGQGPSNHRRIIRVELSAHSGQTGGAWPIFLAEGGQTNVVPTQISVNAMRRLQHPHRCCNGRASPPGSRRCSSRARDREHGRIARRYATRRKGLVLSPLAPLLALLASLAPLALASLAPLAPLVIAPLKHIQAKSKGFC